MANTEQVTGHKGRTSYSFVKQQARRDKRRQQAEARDREYSVLTVDERIKLATSRGGSKRELARLIKSVAAPKATKASKKS